MLLGTWGWACYKSMRKRPLEYSTAPGAADLQAMMWASSLACAFVSSLTFRKIASRKGLKEGVPPSKPYRLECAHTGEPTVETETVSFLCRALYITSVNALNSKGYLKWELLDSIFK